MQLDDWVYSNEEESEMGQLHAIHIHMNAVSAVQRALQQRAARGTIMHCVDCGDSIPEQRRLAVPGVDTCIHCQTQRENYG